MEYLNLRTMERSKGLQPSDLVLQSAQPQSSDSDQGYTTGQDSDISVPENVILQTKNYGMFRLDLLNRAIRQDKVDRLYDAVKTKNLLHLFPIVVTRQFVIVDGQHRWKVAEALDTPIYYIVSSQMQIEDAAFVTRNTDNWKTIDYLHHWCGIGLPEYIALREFWAAHQWLTLGTAMLLCFTGNTGGDGRNKFPMSAAFARGQYTANDIPFATRVCAMARDFSTWIKFWKDTAFVRTIRQLASNSDYDHRQMIQKMQYQSTKLVKCADMESYIAVMDEIYNFRVTEDHRVTLRKLNPRNSKHRSRMNTA